MGYEECGTGSRRLETDKGGIAMSKREIEQILERIEVLKSFLEEHSLEKFQEQVLEVKDFLQRFGSLEELLSHLKKLEGMAYSVKDFLTVDEVAMYLQITKSAVYKMTSKKELTMYKPNGKNIYILRSDLDDWIRKNQILSEEEIERRAKVIAYNMDRERKERRFKKGGRL